VILCAAGGGSHTADGTRRWVLRGVALLLVGPVALCGCATLLRPLHRQDAAKQQAEQLEILQIRVMRYADDYVGGISEPLEHFQEATGDASERLAAQNWKLTQSTAAYTIASGPNAVINSLDMLVLATLSRMVVEDTWVSARFGERAAPLVEAHRRLERRARELAKDVITAEQFAQLQRLLDAWRAQNPHIRAVSYVHLSDVAKAVGPRATGDASVHGILTLLGIDPLSNLDPAVREIAQSRELAERTIYYAQRVPNLLDMQVERLADQFATTPETQRLLANIDRASEAAEATGRLASELPVILARERQAAIEQFMQAVTTETAHTRDLLVDVRRTLEAGTATSSSLGTTIAAFDQLMVEFRVPERPNGAAATPARPFDIIEYTAAAAELTRAADELRQLVGGVEQGSPALLQVTDRAAAKLQNAVDHVYWRMLQLIALTLMGGLLTALAYRVAVRRWFA
jgi:hypothetical protein